MCRFLYPVYPLICLAAASTLDNLHNIFPEWWKSHDILSFFTEVKDRPWLHNSKGAMLLIHAVVINEMDVLVWLDNGDLILSPCMIALQTWFPFVFESTGCEENSTTDLGGHISLVI